MPEQYEIHDSYENDPYADDSMKLVWNGKKMLWEQYYASPVSVFGDPIPGLTKRAYDKLSDHFGLADLKNELPPQVIISMSPESLSEARED